jgi:hypothetical protein
MVPRLLYGKELNDDTRKECNAVVFDEWTTIADNSETHRWVLSFG